MEESLKLKNQICFPLYACSKELIKRYKPLLDKLDLTYTQYIAMMVKKLESKGYITRNRDTVDERNLIISITDSGKKLKNEAMGVPSEISKCVCLTEEEAIELYRLLYKVLGKFGEEDV